MGYVLAFVVIIHTVIFCSTILVYRKIHGLLPYERKEHIIFVLSIIVVTVITFFYANHSALGTERSSVMTAIGYAIFPVTQSVCLLLSYVVVQSFNTFKGLKLRYSPYFLGIIASAPTGALATSFLSPYYWNLFGNNIYGLTN